MNDSGAIGGSSVEGGSPGALVVLEKTRPPSAMGLVDLLKSSSQSGSRLVAAPTELVASHSLMNRLVITTGPLVSKMNPSVLALLASPGVGKFRVHTPIGPSGMRPIDRSASCRPKVLESTKVVPTPLYNSTVCPLAPKLKLVWNSPWPDDESHHTTKWSCEARSVLGKRNLVGRAGSSVRL